MGPDAAQKGTSAQSSTGKVKQLIGFFDQQQADAGSPASYAGGNGRSYAENNGSPSAESNGAPQAPRRVSTSSEASSTPSSGFFNQSTGNDSAQASGYAPSSDR